MPKLNEFLFGKGDKMKQVSKLDQNQQSLRDQYFSLLQNQGAPGLLGQSPGYQQGMGYLQGMYGDNPEAFDKFAAPYLRQFNQEIVPDIAQRFSSMGWGSRNSSAFNQAMARAGEGLSTTLASQMEQLKANLLPQLLNYSQAPMNEYNQMYGMYMGQSPFENVYQPGSTGLVGGMASGLAKGVGQGLGMGFGGPLSSMFGMFGG